MTAGVRALVGTRKGLFMLSGDEKRQDWHVDEHTLEGWAVFHAMVDPRDGSYYAAANHLVYGQAVFRSVDEGQTWTRSTAFPVPLEAGLELEAVWHIEPGPTTRPGTLFLGAAPALLFRTDDYGATWQVNLGILNHPTRGGWVPSAGGLSLHGIQIDPHDPDRMYVSVSAAGAMRSDDGGDTWTVLNKDVMARMMPHPYPEVGQCVHKLLLHPLMPGRVWQQNHCGVYRSDDYGDHWDRVDENGLPSEFGFPLMIDLSNPDVAYVIPEKSYEYHYSSDARLGAYRTRDAGTSWELVADGLPSPAWAAVLREAAAFDDTSVYFGTQSGSVFALTDGDQWVEAVRHLPPITSLEMTPWST